MNYFKTADPDDDSEGELSKRVRYLKKEEGGMDIMCEVSERIMERGRKFGEEQLLRRQVQKKLPISRRLWKRRKSGFGRLLRKWQENRKSKKEILSTGHCIS